MTQVEKNVSGQEHHSKGTPKRAHLQAKPETTSCSSEAAPAHHSAGKDQYTTKPLLVTKATTDLPNASSNCTNVASDSDEKEVRTIHSFTSLLYCTEHGFK